MDHMMEEPSGVPWLKSPLELHSSRADTCELTPAQCEYRRGYWRYWYISDRVYAQGTVYFLCATLGVFSLTHLLSKFTSSRRSGTGAGIQRKPKAIIRYLAYRCYKPSGTDWLSPTVGQILLIVIGILFFSVMTLGPQPYYWPNTRTLSYGGSPPIATRTGWMTAGLLPFVFALPVKANLITTLTGISHERLQVFHHWTSYAMFVLALIHTFPFIVHHIWVEDMEFQWKDSVHYWTGVAALIPQTYLTFMSIPFIRNRFYEVFKATHLLSALVFVVFFFLHCDFRLSSWDYFIATGAIYLSSLLYSQARTFLFHRVRTAKIEYIPCGFIRIKIPTNVSWSPGQHVFVRFLSIGVHCLTAHPFTICSLPNATSKTGETHEMVFYVKPRNGITRRLAALAKQGPAASVKVLIEGPYGGIGCSTFSKFDNALVITGGSGASFSLATIEDILLRHSNASDIPSNNEAASRKTMQIVFATRVKALAQWYKEEMMSLLASYPTDIHISMSIHITSEDDSSSSPPSPTLVDIDPEKSSPGQDTEPLSTDNINCTYPGGRPNIHNIVSSFTEDAAGKSVGIAVCGPASMLHDVRNASALAQRRAFRGDVPEVYLHSECFSL